MVVQGLQPVSSGPALTDSGRASLRQQGFEAPEPGRWRRYAYPASTGPSGATTSRANSPISSTAPDGPGMGSAWGGAKCGADAVGAAGVVSLLG